MGLFKKLKTRLLSFLEKYEGNLFILIPTYLAVGLVNILFAALGVSVASIKTDSDCKGNKLIFD